MFKKYNDGYKIRAGKSTPPGVEGYQDPLWAEENFDRYERLARFRRGSPDPKTRHRSVDGRFLADDEFDMDLPTIYVDGEEWDPADLGLEEADWTFHEVKEIKEFKRRTRRDKEKKPEELEKWWRSRISSIKSSLLATESRLKCQAVSKSEMERTINRTQ